MGTWPGLDAAGVPGRLEFDDKQELNFRFIASAIADTGFYPDSKAVYYFDQEKSLMYRVQLSDRKVEQIADLRHIAQPDMPYWTPWTGTAPDGSPLLMRDLGTREIYALELEK